ncbi:hypothetical protein J6590_063386 [Homalodisca vitripennis]|nr:hypothetical protein J6590_063386 [Homalodisca vitripennis]
MGKLIQEGTIFPPPENLPSSEIKLPVFAVGDEAFKLSNHVIPAARCVIDCSRGSAPSRAAKTTQRARKTPPLVYREPVVSSVTEHGARSAKTPVAELGKRSFNRGARSLLRDWEHCLESSQSHTAQQGCRLFIVCNISKFSADDDSALIDLVSEYDILWKMSHPDLKNYLKIDKLWNGIGQKLKKTGDSCKKRWRSRALHARKKETIGTGKAAKTKRRASYWESLSFLNNVEDERKGLTNAGETENTEVAMENEDLVTNDPVDATEPVENMKITAKYGRQGTRFSELSVIWNWRNIQLLPPYLPHHPGPLWAP